MMTQWWTGVTTCRHRVFFISLFPIHLNLVYLSRRALTMSWTYLFYKLPEKRCYQKVQRLIVLQTNGAEHVNAHAGGAGCNVNESVFHVMLHDQTSGPVLPVFFWPPAPSCISVYLSFYVPTNTLLSSTTSSHTFLTFPRRNLVKQLSVFMALNCGMLTEFWVVKLCQLS